MEDFAQFNPTIFESTKDNYSNELDVAVKAVQMACSLCQRVQKSLLSKSTSLVQSKDDNSLVTIAGNFFNFSDIASCFLQIAYTFFNGYLFSLNSWLDND